MVKKKRRGGRKKIQSKSNNNRSWEGSAQGPSDRSETSMLFWVILSHNRGGTDYPSLIGVKGVIYVLNLVWVVSYMVLNGIDLVIYTMGR